MTVLLLIFVPKIIFLRQEKNARKGGRLSLGSSLRVTGRNEFVSRISGPTHIATNVVSGISRKHFEDLRQNLVQTGTVDNTTDFLSIFKSIGIFIFDDGTFRGSDVMSQSYLASTVPNATNLESNLEEKPELTPP